MRVIAAVVVLIVTSLAAVPVQANDPLDIRTTDWRMADWRSLEAEEQDWVLTGFALGWWGGEEPEAAPSALPLDEWRSAMKRDLGRAEGQGLRLATGLTLGARTEPPPAVAMTGEAWMALTPRHRLALLHGLYAGTYARALLDHLGPDIEEVALDQAFGRARRLVKPELALAPSLLFARLSDWYFYRDRRAAPLIEAVQEIARQIKGP